MQEQILPTKEPTHKIPVLLYYFISVISPVTETLLSAALPFVAMSLNTGGNSVQFSTTSYYLGFALGILMLGRISDLYGRRPILILGLIIYLIINFCLSFTNTIEMLIFLRLLQGYGASVGSVIAQSMIRDSYKGKKLTNIYSFLSVIVPFCISLSIFIGGFVIEHYHNWQYLFRILCLWNICTIIIVLKFLPETNQYIGFNNDKFFKIFKSMMQDKLVLSYVLIVGGFNGILYSFFIQAPFIFIKNLQISHFEYTILFTILSILNIFSWLFSHYLNKKLRSFQLKKIGIILSIIACSALVISSQLIDYKSNSIYPILMIMIPMFLQSSAHVIIIPVIMQKALRKYHMMNGSASSIFGFLYYLITSFIAGMVALLHSETIFYYSLISISIIMICTILLIFIGKEKKRSKEKIVI